MHLTPLHPLFGVEVHEVDLRAVHRTSGYAEIRDAFEEHSLLLFRRQNLDDEAHLSLGALFGPIEDRSMGGNGPRPRMANVSNRLESGLISAPDSAHTLDLIANQLWHTDSTFLPVPALANILAARVLSSRGGETELASTRVAWRELPAGASRPGALGGVSSSLGSFAPEDLARACHRGKVHALERAGLEGAVAQSRERSRGAVHCLPRLCGRRLG